VRCRDMGDYGVYIKAEIMGECKEHTAGRVYVESYARS